MKVLGLAFSVFLSFTLVSFRALGASPIDDETPGYLCSTSDPDFDKLDYAEKIARCARNVSHQEKLQIAAIYEVAEKDWPKYEFDHLIPLCAGGANGIRNVWPQPLGEAHEKDKVEDSVCRRMRAGTLSQGDAVDEIYAWFRHRHSCPNGQGAEKDGNCRPERVSASLEPEDPKG